MEKNKRKAHHTIYDALELWGFAIWVFDENDKLIDNYAGGDSRWESQTYGTGGYDEETLLEMAHDIAVNMHEGHGGNPRRGVAHEPDCLIDAFTREVLTLEHAGKVQTKLADKLMPPQEFPFGRAPIW